MKSLAGAGFNELFRAKEEDLVRQVLSTLRKVIFGYDGHFGRGVAKVSSSCNSFTTSTIFRSRPLLASVSKFQGLNQDPRSIEAELKRVFMGFGDPRDQIYRWFRLLEKWQVDHSDHTVDYRFMITIDDRRVQTREDAVLSVRHGEKQWTEWMRDCENDSIPCEDAEQALPTAYGFWLFPIAAFGPIPTASTQIRKTVRRGVRVSHGVWDLFQTSNLSEHKPELCLQCLPETPVSEINLKSCQDEGPLDPAPDCATRRAWSVHCPKLTRRAYIHCC